MLRHLAFRWAAIAVVWVGASGCSSLVTQPDGPRSEAEAWAEDGDLHLRLAVDVVLGGATPVLQVAAAVPASSIVAQHGEGRTVWVRTLRLQDERGQRTLHEWVQLDTLQSGDTEVPLFRDSLALAPGRYVVRAELRDEATDRAAQAVRRVRVPTAEAAYLGPVVRTDGAVPLLDRLLPARPDSVFLHVWVQVPPEGAVARWTLRRLRADTSIASPPHWLAASAGSLAYRGWEEAPQAPLVARAQPLTPGAHRVQVAVPATQPGLFVFRLELLRETEGRRLGQVADVVAITHPAYPALSSLDEAIEALEYLAYPKERAAIAAGADEAEQLARFDAFWGTLYPDRRLATSVFRLYYQRVEAANRRFGGYKAGWKTDRGMVFLLLGEPLYIDTQPDHEQWYYGSTLPDQALVFRFDRTDLPANASLMPVYVLQRRLEYEEVWRSAVQRWREGVVR